MLVKVGDIANATRRRTASRSTAFACSRSSRCRRSPTRRSCWRGSAPKWSRSSRPPASRAGARCPGCSDPYGRLVGATFLRNNLNKRSVAIDLKNPAGRDLVLRMAPRFDVVAENFKPGTARPPRPRLRRRRRRPPHRRLRVGLGRREPRRVAVRRVARVRVDGRSGVGHLRVHPPAGTAPARQPGRRARRHQLRAVRGDRAPRRVAPPRRHAGSASTSTSRCSTPPRP